MLKPKDVLALPGLDVMMELTGEDLPAARVFWVKFGTANHHYGELEPVEGKLYLPEKLNGDLIHFSPGFPGGNAGRFERRHARAFIKAGYALSTHRFNGTSLVGPDSEEVINAPERLELARKNNERHLGGTIAVGRGIVDVVCHPAAVLAILHPAFIRIHTIGHSMGAAANNISIDLLEFNPAFDKIGVIISLAGYLGGTGEEEDVWDGLVMPMTELTRYELARFQEKDVNFADSESEFRKAMAEIAGRNELVRLPPRTKQILFFAINDPLIRCPQEGEEVGPASNYKMIVRDERGQNDPKPHSMAWISPTDLLYPIAYGIEKGWISWQTLT